MLEVAVGGRPDVTVTEGNERVGVVALVLVTDAELLLTGAELLLTLWLDCLLSSVSPRL
jgi:hypothetical protein